MSDIDIKPFEEGTKNCLDRLNLKNMKSALVKGANVITKEAKSQVKKKVGSSTTHYTKPNKKGKIRTYSINTGIKSTQYKKGSTYSNEAVAASHIMGDFRLKFFENGTSVRKTKSGATRGKISNGKFKFFETSTASKEQEAYDVIEKELNKLIVL